MTGGGLSSDLVTAFVILDIAIIIVAARLVGGLARKLGQPTVVGEIVAGILLGPTILGATLLAWHQPWSFLHCKAALATLPPSQRVPSVSGCFFPPQARSVLGVLGQIALIFYMFLVGLELDPALLKGKAKGIAMVSIGAVAVPVAFALFVGPLLYGKSFVAGFGSSGAPSKASFTLMIGAMLAVTAFPVMARILQEKKLVSSRMGSIGIAAAAVVTVLMFLLVGVASGVASNSGPSNLVLKFVVAAVYLAVMFFVVRPALAPLGRAYEARGTLTAGMFATIIVVVVASAYAADRIGINVIVGGFIAGVILPARHVLFRELATRLSDFVAIILLPIFLAFSGLNTDFTKLTVSSLAGIVLFLAAGIVSKWVGGAVFARAGGLSWPEGNVLGILMNCRGLLVLVVALIALNQNVITPILQVGGVLMALVTTVMTGPLFDVFSRRLPAEPVEPAVEVGPPPVQGAFRLLAVVGDLERAPGVAHAAFSLVGGRPTPEVVFSRVFPLPTHAELLSGLNEEAREAERTLRALRLLTSFSPEDVSVTILSFSSSEIAEDIARLARDHQCDAVVVEADRSARVLIRELLDTVDADLIAWAEPERADEASLDGPVSVASYDGSEPDAMAVAGALGASLGRQVEVLHGQAGDPADLIAASRRSSALVVTTDSGQRESAGPLPGIAERLLDEAECPVFVLRPARVRAAL